VIVFNFVNGANGNGHVGIMAVNPNTGAGLYGGFNPAHDGLIASFHDNEGSVVYRNFPPGLYAVIDGHLTPTSLREIKAICEISRINMAWSAHIYFKTSDTQTAALRDSSRGLSKARRRYYH
jgi:hypothetical protein